MNKAKDNELIEEFMGWKIIPNVNILTYINEQYDYAVHESISANMPPILKTIEVHGGTVENYLDEDNQPAKFKWKYVTDYSQDWNHLMGVLERISHLDIEIESDGGELIAEMEGSLLSFSKELTFNSIVSFIKWYNKNEKS
jgi:hypothetical protein